MLKTFLIILMIITVVGFVYFLGSILEKLYGLLWPPEPTPKTQIIYIARIKFKALNKPFNRFCFEEVPDFREKRNDPIAAAVLLPTIPIKTIYPKRFDFCVYRTGTTAGEAMLDVQFWLEVNREFIQLHQMDDPDLYEIWVAMFWKPGKMEETFSIHDAVPTSTDRITSQ